MNTAATSSTANDSTSAPRTAARRRYPSDLTDQQWERVSPLLPSAAPNGKRKVDLREVLNGINFRWTTGCVWRMLPHDLPPWETVYWYFHRWQLRGLLPRLREALVSRRRVPQARQRHTPPFPPSTRFARGNGER